MVDPAGPQPMTSTSQRRSVAERVLISSLGMAAARPQVMPPFTLITWPVT